MAENKISYTKLYGQYLELITERTEWEAEWRQISKYLLPGRGVYQTLSRPRKKQLTTNAIINPAGEDALGVLTSGMHGGLTSPSRPWFKLRWANSEVEDILELKNWLQDCEVKLHQLLHDSNFYSIINSFYTEYGGFGNSCVYVGGDTDNDEVAFRFELLTAGEYSFSLGPDGRPDVFFRTLFKSRKQIADEFEDTVDPEIKKAVAENRVGILTIDRTLLECVFKQKLGDKAFTRVIYDITGTDTNNLNSEKKPLRVDGFYEFPYPFARWNTIGNDVYGVGPGSRALPDIKRLQEMEKAFLMAVHKSVDPPLNVPARMRGKINTLPGGENYYANPNEDIKSIYDMRFDLMAVSASIERVEQRIQRNFYNDIFLGAQRDPNASPMKARQVEKLDQEGMLRLGPVIERLQHEFFQLLIERCFNIALRKDLFPSISPELAEMAQEYRISLVSPLATAQRLVALGGINSFLGFIGQAAQFSFDVMDKIDLDATVDEFADITGVSHKILRKPEEVKRLRQMREAQQRQMAEREQAITETQVIDQSSLQSAQARKSAAEAAKTLAETQQMTNPL